ncbi:12531_t:CDS:2, partial [Dentiscutata heterogama]
SDPGSLDILIAVGDLILECFSNWRKKKLYEQESELTEEESSLEYIELEDRVRRLEEQIQEN